MQPKFKTNESLLNVTKSQNYLNVIMQIQMFDLIPI